MPKESESGRKVRGGRIRSSREEKRRERSRGAGATTGAIARQSADDVDERMSARAAYVPDPEPFVETDSVRAVRERVERWLDVGRPVHLIGPTGCGKTALALSAADRRDRPVVFLNGDADMETADLVGEYAGEERHSVRDKYVHNVQKSTDVVRERWVDNPLTTAVREGGTLVYNEFARTKPVANNVLLSVFEEGVLELPGRRGEDRYVEVHPEFRAILTSNSAEYAGVHEPQDALLDRLVGVHMDFYDAETERRIVAANVDAEAAVVADAVAVVRALRERVDVTVGTRAAVMVAEVVDADTDPETVATVVTDVLASKVAGREAADRLRTEVEAVVSDTLDRRA